MSFAKRIIRTRIDPKIEESDNPLVVSAEILKISSSASERELGWPRGSKLYDMCVRQHVLGTVEQAKVKEWSTAAGRVTFGIGNALHFWFQNTPDLFGDKRRGWWRCLACRKLVGFGGPPKKRCRFCGAHQEAIVYYEHGIKLSGDPFYFTGHVDMFLLHHSLIRVTEMKSMNGDKFDKLVAPLAAHEWQLQSYMWALQRDKRFPIPVDPNVGYLAYITKKHASGKLPVKIFPVKRTESVIERIEKTLGDFAKGLDHFPKHMPPAIDECERANFTNYRAKSCPVKSQCIKRLEAD
jgi:hypothetical protein